MKGKDLSHIPLCKVTNEEEIHHGFTYKLGKNTDTDINTDKYGGLHFVECKDIFQSHFMRYGDGYRIITVEPDEDVVKKVFDKYGDEVIIYYAKSITLLPGKQKFSEIIDEKKVIQMIDAGYYMINKDNWYNVKVCGAALKYDSYNFNKNLYNNYFSNHCKNDLSVLKKIKDTGVEIGIYNSIKVFLSRFRSKVD